MGKDSGVLIIGILLIVFGGFAFKKGHDGETLALYHQPSASFSSDEHSPNYAKGLGGIMVIAGLICVWQSGYPRKRK